MVRPGEPEKGNPGWREGLGKRSEVWHFAQGLRGSKQRQTEKRLNSMQAVAAGRGTATDIWNKLVKKRGGRSTDFEVVAVFSETDKLGKIAPPLVSFRSPDPHEDSHDLEAVQEHMRHVCVGFVVVVLDRKTKKLIAHARPLLVDDSSLKLLEALVAKAAAVDKAGDLTDWRTS